MTRQLPMLQAVQPDWTAQSHPARPLRIALVNMPWARTDTPSIQCGLLKAGLTRYGHDVDVHYANLELASLLGRTRYRDIYESPEERQVLLGEWLFTAAAYAGSVHATDDRYLQTIDRDDREKEALQRLRDETLPAWIDALATAVPWESYDLVGFTSTFAQNLAALALARRIKDLDSRVVTVLGGANADGEMGQELLRAFPPVDYAISGEGDLILPVFVAAVAAGRSPLGLPGVSGRDAQGVVVTNGQAPKVEDMDCLPEPDYGDYFAALDRLGHEAVLGDQSARLLLETSRGCWWGAKHHCTFCGLNANGMAYRSKSPDRVLGELERLVERHRILAVDAVDNIIDMGYLGSVCKQLAETHWDLRMFYEIKANLTREQLGVLKAAGISEIQPGVESLSTRVLGLMRKGSTMLTNVRLLKWSRYYDMDVHWAVLFGFPGEEDADYEAQIALFPSLVHLPPPGAAAQLWLERFSPYFTEDFPITNVRPLEAYRAVYPMAGVDLDKVAYFFDYSAEGVVSPAVQARLTAAVAQWRSRWADANPPVLAYERGPGWLSIVDTRGASPRRVTLRAWYASAYEYCGDKPHTLSRISAALEDSARPDEDELAAFLDRCVADRLMVCEDGKYLSLALPRNGNW